MTATVVIDKNLRAPAQKVWAAIEVGRRSRSLVSDHRRLSHRRLGRRRVALHDLSRRRGRDARPHRGDCARERRLRYHRTHHPFPVSDYFGTVEVFDAGPGASRLLWTVRFKGASENEAAVRELVHNAISDGVDGLERELIAEAG